MPGAGRRGLTETSEEQKEEIYMTLQELSVEYRAHAETLSARVKELEQRLEQTKNPRERCLLQDRIRMLSTMVREARELAVLTEHYYDRGYRRNVRYTV